MNFNINFLHQYAQQQLQIGLPINALSTLANFQDATSKALVGIAYSQLKNYRESKINLNLSIKLANKEKNNNLIYKCKLALVDVLLAEFNYKKALILLNEIENEYNIDNENLNYIKIQQARVLFILKKTNLAFEILQTIDINSAFFYLAKAEFLIINKKYNKAFDLLTKLKTKNVLLNVEKEKYLNALNDKSFILINYKTKNSVKHISLIEIEKINEIYLDNILKQFGEINFGKKNELFRILQKLSCETITAKAIYGFSSESLNERLKTQISRLKKITSLDIIAKSNKYSLENKITTLKSENNNPILTILSDGNNYSASEIAAKLNLNKRTINRHISELLEKKIIIRKGASRNIKYSSVLRGENFATQLLLRSRSV